MTSLNVLDGKNYYHGTSPSSAICIFEEGFRLLDEEFHSRSGALGTGIYVTRNVTEALLFGGVRSLNNTYVLQLEFTRGTKIARLGDQPDQQVLDSLRREFGHEVLGPRFAQAIPRNKHLKPRELFVLIGYYERSGVLFEAATKRHVRRWLRRLGYHGYGHSHNDLGVMLFDPSRLILRDVKRLRRPSEDPYGAEPDPSALLPVNPVDLVADAEAELHDREERNKEDVEDIRGDDEAEADLGSHLESERTELERRRKLLSQYKKRHGVE